jgi:hypothetical protein
MRRLMSEIRARLISSECPLTRTQVQHLAWQASEEDGRPEFELWLNWSGSCEEVGQWLWQFWLENADEGEGHDQSWPLCFPASARPRRTPAAPATARDAGQRQPRVAYNAGW